jgi:hypothetical protein
MPLDEKLLGDGFQLLADFLVDFGQLVPAGAAFLVLAGMSWITSTVGRSSDKGFRPRFFRVCEATVVRERSVSGSSGGAD